MIFDEVAGIGVGMQNITLGATGFVSASQHFMTFSLSESLTFSFCSFFVPFVFLLLLRPVSVQVIGAWVDLEFYVLNLP